MCALEAMALGVPIVSTPTDGLKEVVDNGVTGYLETTDEKLSARYAFFRQKEVFEYAMKLAQKKDCKQQKNYVAYIKIRKRRITHMRHVSDAICDYCLSNCIMVDLCKRCDFCRNSLFE